MILQKTYIILMLLAFVRASAASETYVAEDVLDIEKMKPRGSWYEATVPATLDLAERAKLSINVLTRNVEPDTYYGVYQSFTFNTLPLRRHALTWNITPKNARTLPLLRTMCGSDFNLDVEYGMMKAFLDQVCTDGQMYYPFDGSSPPKGTSYPQTNALVVFAMLNNYARDGNKEWLKWIDLMCKGLREAAIQVEDRAYYPMQSGIGADGVWKFMLNTKPIIPYYPPDEPQSDQQGHEGAAKSDQVRHMAVLAKHHQLTGNKESLELARKISRFVLKPEMWTDTLEEEGYPGHEHGIQYGHFHNGVQGLTGLFLLAEATDDDWLRQFVREGYDHAVLNGILRVGFYPAWSWPQKYDRAPMLSEVTEPCALSDLIRLGVLMNDAGMGDYWDDVDHILRNTLIGQQIVNLDALRKVTGTKPDSPDDKMLQCFIGGFANGTPVAQGQFDMAGCCTVNGNDCLYYAWHGITRFDEGVATVNLFLNRASPWMDVNSYLPYEGKVTLRNKKAHTAMVRIPRWVDPGKVVCEVNRKRVSPVPSGRYLMVQNLKPGDVVRLEFPLHERTDTYVINGNDYEFTFRGSTVVKAKGPSDSDTGPLFDGMGEPLTDTSITLMKMYQDRDPDHSGPAPMRKVKRFVADKIIPLGTF